MKTTKTAGHVALIVIAYVAMTLGALALHVVEQIDEEQDRAIAACKTPSAKHQTKGQK